ncbi:hypothetical protein CVT91_00620 [Candidatus Atribacteria bacterium HGW-Atribacteria-1]|nr:MAG: hypothetical protein CVT91_00620 [Candidatus Atribacteria bacterium HGW-Atribacteria-1]
MKVLIVIYSYYPKISPRAFRWSAISEYLVKKGNDVDVICAWSPGLIRNERINCVNIYRVGNTPIEIIRNRYNKNIFKKNKILKKNTELKNVLSLVKWVNINIWRKICWPDPICLWFFPAIKKAKELVKINKYNVLISVSLPFTPHLIGLKIKKYYPGITWVMDIGDPFYFLYSTPTNNHKLYKKINYLIESKSLKCADRIAVTTRGTLEKYINIFPESTRKIHVIPPLISSTNKIKSKNSIFINHDKIKLVFMGTMYKKIRNPRFLLKVFNKLLDTNLAERLELHIFGNINDCFDFFIPCKEILNKKIFIHGKVNHEIALQALSDADFLINIGNTVSYQLASKVAEYANSGKPIINFSENKMDASIIFFNKYPASLNLLEKDYIANSGNITKVIDFIENPPIIKPLILKKFLANYQIEKVTESYRKLFESR